MLNTLALSKSFTRSRPDIIQGLVENEGILVTKFSINTPLRMQHFLAQCAEETDGFHTLEEYASGAEYEGRKDLGNVDPGDGVIYKGRGYIMITGKYNYETYGKILHMDLLTNPHYAETPPIALDIAGLYWLQNGLNAFADKDDILTITKRINGGLNGLSTRRAYLALLKTIIK